MWNLGRGLASGLDVERRARVQPPARRGQPLSSGEPGPHPHPAVLAGPGAPPSTARKPVDRHPRLRPKPVSGKAAPADRAAQGPAPSFRARRRVSRAKRGSRVTGPPSRPPPTSRPGRDACLLTRGPPARASPDFP